MPREKRIADVNACSVALFDYATDHVQEPKSG